jgi:hypothetical protein
MSPAAMITTDAGVCVEGGAEDAAVAFAFDASPEADELLRLAKCVNKSATATTATNAQIKAAGFSLNTAQRYHMHPPGLQQDCSE